jgi:hypothetical protein
MLNRTAVETELRELTDLAAKLAALMDYHARRLDAALVQSARAQLADLDHKIDRAAFDLSLLDEAERAVD